MSENIIERIENLEENAVKNTLEEYTGNLNNLKATGFYYASGTASNTPQAGFSFYITVIALNENFIYQEAKKVIDDVFETYERQCYLGTWSEWKNTHNSNSIFLTQLATIMLPVSDTAKYGYVNKEITIPNGYKCVSVNFRNRTNCK